MPRTYKRKLGSREYQNYTSETMEKAVEDILQDRLTLRKASKKYGIPLGTLSHKVNKKHGGHVGGPTSLTDDEEQRIAKILITLSLWRFPLDLFELRMLVKAMLDKAGKTIKRFKNNIPGADWAKGFLARHKALTHRVTQNIKLSRASVGVQEINKYFDNLEESIRNVPAENIWNYDETNFSDDPGKKKAIVKRGVKYPERVMNQSKASISVMFCGNAAGKVLPPYVVYKAEHLWERWCMGGPKGARYNRTRSGWFDGCTFYDWFITTFLTAVRKQDGPKVLIGDNLSSHLDEDIVTECENNNVRFIFLPPNSTHLTQPLDVAYFRPLKMKWRSILAQWKIETKSTSCLPKNEFPRLLKHLEDQVEMNKSENMQAGFRACGIMPLDRNAVLKRLPQEKATQISDEVANDSVVDFLQAQSPQTQQPQRQKRTRVNIEAGKSVSTEDFTRETESSDSAESSSQQSDNTDTDESDEDIGEDQGSGTSGTQSQQSGGQECQLKGVTKVTQPSTIKPGDWLLVNFAEKVDGKNKKLYLGKIDVRMGDNAFQGTFVKHKTRRMCDASLFVYPDQPDICIFESNAIIGKVDIPTTLRRGVLQFAVNSSEW